MGDHHHNISSDVRDKQPSESEESDSIDRARRHAQNGHKRRVQSMLQTLF
jgi:hypothetical protein